jgi:hypothetical protein
VKGREREREAFVKGREREREIVCFFYSFF